MAFGHNPEKNQEKIVDKKTMHTLVVKVLFKKVDMRLISNYRPISLASTDDKILTKVITEQIKTVLKHRIGTIDFLS